MTYWSRLFLFFRTFRILRIFPVTFSVSKHLRLRWISINIFRSPGRALVNFDKYIQQKSWAHKICFRKFPTEQVWHLKQGTACSTVFCKSFNSLVNASQIVMLFLGSAPASWPFISKGAFVRPSVRGFYHDVLCQGFRPLEQIYKKQ